MANTNEDKKKQEDKKKIDKVDRDALKKSIDEKNKILKDNKIVRK